MKLDIDKLIRLKGLADSALGRNYKIVLEPEDRKGESLGEDIVYDKAEWKITDTLRKLVVNLANNESMSDEEKIFLIYKKLCYGYVYDDNLISYIQKDGDGFTVPDWYGRDVGEEWERNREDHNRRVCYEVSRYLAKAVSDLFQNSDDVNVCILWDEGLTHYFVGIATDEYSMTLDLDDFNNIKDMTRIKAGLTAQGIVILEDKNDKLKKALNEFNKDKQESAIKRVEVEIENLGTKGAREPLEARIEYLQNAMNILSKKFGIDSQGVFEYMKEIIDVTMGPRAREKVWKKVSDREDAPARYIRCLLVSVDDETYMMDVDSVSLSKFDRGDFEKSDVFLPYKKLHREDTEEYDGM